MVLRGCGADVGFGGYGGLGLDGLPTATIDVTATGPSSTQK